MWRDDQIFCTPEGRVRAEWLRVNNVDHGA
jgi:hypothetical protein